MNVRSAAAWASTRKAVLVAGAVAVAGLGAGRTLSTEEWLITLLRGLSMGAITFLVASGLSLIFGLMGVLNLAHGELFLIGAVAGWTLYVRPDTAVDAVAIALLVATGLATLPLARRVVPGARSAVGAALPWASFAGGGGLLWWAVPRMPLAVWDADVYTESPVGYSLALGSGTLVPPPAAEFAGPAWLIVPAIVAGAAAVAIGVAALEPRRAQPSCRWTRTVAVAGGLLALAVLVIATDDPLTSWLFGLSTTWRFFLAMAVAFCGGAALGSLFEATLIRPLYSRPLYQLMLTLGVGFILVEVVRSVWGVAEFDMPKPAAFSGQGDGCPATTPWGLVANGCSTMQLLGTRVRSYNELFIPAVGLVVLVGVTVLLRRTRLGMIIRAGVQDREMVEALGINVRRVFTLVFGLGVGLAALGGVLAAPSLGLSTGMGARVLLLALIAMAVGGLTSFPGAAVGAVLVGLVQQLVIEFGQSGIDIPFLDEPFKPSPPLVPASVVLLMVVVLLVRPAGLFGRGER